MAAVAAASPLARLLHFAKTNPLPFGVGFSCVKTSASDLIVQKLIERREEIDWRRNAAFASFGFCYLGFVQYGLYVPVFGRLFPKTEAFAAKSLREKAGDLAGQAGVAAQVFLDQCLHHPFVYFPASGGRRLLFSGPSRDLDTHNHRFYMTKELVLHGAGASPSRVRETWSENFWGDLRALWQVWVPATALNFAFSPMWMRIPVVASTSLVWTMILSSMRGAEPATVDDVIPVAGESRHAMLGFGGVDARTAEVFAKGLARRISVAGDELEALKRRLTPGSDDEPLESDAAAPRAARAATKRQEVAHLCVTASGKDRVGLVHLLAKWIYDRGGNITGSKMLRMNDEFTVILHVTSKDRVAASHLRADLLVGEGAPSPVADLAISARELAAAPSADGPKSARVRLTGEDRPGIVVRVTELLSAAGCNIDELATDTIAVQKDDGTTRPFFLLEGHVTAKNEVRPADFDKRLDKLRKDLGAKITVTWS